MTHEEDQGRPFSYNGFVMSAGTAAEDDDENSKR